MTVPGVELAVLDLDFGLQSSELGYFVLVAETAAIETTHKNSKGQSTISIRCSLLCRLTG